MTDPLNHSTNAAAIIEAVERLSPHAVIGKSPLEDGRLALAVLPAGRKIEDLTPYLDKLLDAPRWIEATARMTTVQSLVDYLNRFKIGDSAVFANDDPAKPSLCGVIDYHGGTDPESVDGENDTPDSTPGSTATPRFGRHTALYTFPISEQFGAWSGIYGKGLGHVEMAEFLNERRYDIANPPLDWMSVDPETVKLILHLLNIHDDQGDLDDGAADQEPDPTDDDRYIPRSALYKLRQIRFGSAARLLQMARTVEISANAKSVEGFNPKTGERTVLFEEEHETRDKQGRRIVVPDAFLLKIPVFEGETPQLVPVQLQYRKIPGGGVKWFMSLVEWQRVVRFAVNSEAERVREATGLPLFYGARQAA